MRAVARRLVAGVIVLGVVPPLGAQSDRTAPLIAPNATVMASIPAHQAAVAGVAFSLDGRFLASGSADSTVRVWDVESGDLLLTLGGDGGPVSCVAFSPDGRWLASGSADNVIRIWDAASGDLITQLSGHAALVSALAFGPNGRQLVSGSADNTVRVWDARTWEAVRTFRGHAGKVSSVAISPDGEWIASGSWDQSVRVWAVDSAGPAARILILSSDVLFDDVAVTFSTDGRFLAAGSRDQTVRVWETERYAEVRRLAGHGDVVVAVAVSADGRMLASASDSTIHVWDLESGQILQVARGHRSQVYGIAFSPDGYLASGAQDATVRIWLPYLDPEVIAGDSALQVAFAPKDQFESSEAFRQRLGKAQRRYPVESRRVYRRRANARAMRLLASRQEVEFGDSVVTLGAYDADREEYPLTVLGRPTVLKLPAPAAKQLFTRRAELRVQAVQRLGADGVTLRRSDLQVTHPMLAAPWPVPADREDSLALESEAMARMVLPADLEVDSLRLVLGTGDSVLAPGDTATLRFRVRNDGRGPASAVRVTGTAMAPIGGLAAFVGRIAPGTAREVVLSLVAGAGLVDTSVSVRLRIREANGFDAPLTELTLRTRARPAVPSGVVPPPVPAPTSVPVSPPVVVPPQDRE